MPTSFRRSSRVLLPLLLIALHCTCVRAQLRISRQVIAAAVFSSTPNGNAQQLKMTATAGEVFVGTRRGDVRATVGFQQPDDDVIVSLFTIGQRRITVRAYPNPAVDRLTVDLTNADGLLTEIHLIDLHGRTLLRRAANTSLVEIPEVAKLPGGTYFLRGTDQTGQAYSLGTILLTPH